VGDFTILLVEDDLDVREALAEALRDEGYAVDCAGDGEQALHYLRRGGRPGLILLDLMMPRMSGSEFRMLQKVDSELSDLPVVLLSADGRMEEKARALETDGAIRKPIDLDVLLATIERFSKRAS
jgi:two-component system, chemotaxis family, chemotaxis protein CheY